MPDQYLRFKRLIKWFKTTIVALAVLTYVFLLLQFDLNNASDIERTGERVLVVVCDGPHGHAANILGLSDEFVQHPCRGYGAVAAVERPGQRLVPTPETRVHNLTFDVQAYGTPRVHNNFPHNFHLKIFGSISHRYMALAVPKVQTKLIKTLRLVLDQTVSDTSFIF